MKGSARLIRVLGIDVSIHWTFLLLIAWIVFASVSSGAGVPGTVGSVLFVLAIFVCVVLHEFGHALAARAYGVRTKGITILPIGGVAALERMPTKPSEEFVVAIAGPAVNVVIAAVLFAGVALLGDATMAAGPIAEIPGGFIQRLAIVNIFLVVFNMLPAFPMDGGRVLRALLASRLDYVRATEIAAAVGKFMAVLFAIWALAAGGGPFLLLIAVFVFFGGQAETVGARSRMAFMHATVADAMLADPYVMERDALLGEARALLLKSSQQDFPIVDRGTLVGLLTRAGLVEGLGALGETGPVEQAMLHPIRTLSPDAPLEEGALRVQETGAAVPVVHDDRLVGLLTLDNLSDYMMLRQAGTRRAKRAG